LLFSKVIYRLGAAGREIMHNEMFIWDQCEVYEELICLLTMPESARSVPDCFIENSAK
jgi:hypothetical protein